MHLCVENTTTVLMLCVKGWEAKSISEMHGTGTELVRGISLERRFNTYVHWHIA